MISITQYKWHGHDIKIQAHANPKSLWLNYKLDLTIDNQKINYFITRSLIKSHTSFALRHEGKNLKGQIISAGFPCAPFLSQLIIIDDSILGKSQLLISKRIFTYTLMSCLVLATQFT